VQSLLGQDQQAGETDDGLEVGVCFINPAKQQMSFAGARFSLWKANQDEVIEIKGDRKSLGYRRYPQETRFADFKVALNRGDAFYLTTDGLIDQIGGPRARSFGKGRFQSFIANNRGLPMPSQAENLKRVFSDYQGAQVRRDDLTVLGFVPITA
jgi:serine phosphatase RsbU (regulator of sigma subunit)